jgi:transcriptional adapter 2-alpha
MAERKSKKRSEKKPSGSSHQSRSLYHCNSCRRDLSKTIHIKCAECPEFDLCGDCFAAGVELGHHKKTHSYRVVEDLTGEVFADGWGADEELLLLDAIEMYGLGNWEDIEAHVGSKTAQECEDHYFSTFIDVETYPLPGLPSSHDGRRVSRTKITDRKGVTASKANLRGFEKAVVGEEVGFIPKREDFAIEYEEGAEDFIANLEVVDSDLENEEKLRTKVSYHMSIHKHCMWRFDIDAHFWHLFLLLSNKVRFAS